MTDEKMLAEESINFEEAYKNSLMDIEEKSIVNAKVVQVSNEVVFLDFGYKSEAHMPSAEFKILPKIGEMIEVFIVKLEGEDGHPVVSKKFVEYLKTKNELEKICHEKTLVKGKVISSRRNGITVEYNSVYGFIPISMLDNKRIDEKELAGYVDKEIEFFIERLEFKNNQGKKKDGKVEEEFIANRRRFLQDKNRELRKEFFDNSTVGEILEGTVKSLTDFGAFIDIGGVDALLRVKDASWVRNIKIEDVVKAGEKLKVKILTINSETKKVTVGLKQLQKDPWDDFADKYNLNDVVVGNVVSITSYGAFVKIIDGVEGLLHVSDMSWVKKINNPSELLKVGQNVELKIVKIDKDNKKVSLSLKHLLDNPWDKAEDKYKLGTKVKGKVKTVTTFGYFIELEEGIDALLHLEDISWTESIKNPYDFLKEGDDVEAVVIQLDLKKSKIKVGIKQMSKDPWGDLSNKYKSGDVIKVTVKEIDDENGILVNITDEITCFIPVSHLGMGKIGDIKTNLKKDFEPGNVLETIITAFDPNKRKINVSVKEFVKMKERESVKDFLHDAKEDSTFTIGDMIKFKDNNK